MNKYEMDEKAFMELLISERMTMHHDRFREDYPPTPEQLAEVEKANASHDKVFAALDTEHRELLEFCEDVEIADSTRENEYFYRAGVKDGVNLDRLVRQMKEG